LTKHLARQTTLWPPAPTHIDHACSRGYSHHETVQTFTRDRPGVYMDSAVGETRRCAGKRARSCVSSPTHACLLRFRFCMPLPTSSCLSHETLPQRGCCMHAPSGDVHVPVPSRGHVAVKSSNQPPWHPRMLPRAHQPQPTSFQSQSCMHAHANNEQLTRHHILAHSRAGQTTAVDWRPLIRPLDATRRPLARCIQPQ
jgi:hypothetical protein